MSRAPGARPLTTRAEGVRPRRRRDETRVDLALAKVARIRRRLAALDRFLGPDADEFLGDLERVERAGGEALVLLERCIDLAIHILVGEGWVPRRRIREATVGRIFEVLGEREVLSPATTFRMMKGAGLGPLVDCVHSPPEDDLPYEGTRRSLPVLREFCCEMERWLTLRAWRPPHGK